MKLVPNGYKKKRLFFRICLCPLEKQMKSLSHYKYIEMITFIGTFQQITTLSTLNHFTLDVQKVFHGNLENNKKPWHKSMRKLFYTT
jgi:hypothetical protein